MGNIDRLKQYFALADYIAAINGSNCEVIVHDLRDLNHSIVYIKNGHITNRAVGGSITNFALELLQKENYKDQEYIVNYIGTTKNNKKILRSSTFFIKNSAAEIIGLLCVNIDITDLLKARDTVDGMVMVNELENIGSKENFDISVDDLVDDIIHAVLLESGAKIAETSLEQKKELVRKMESKGVFKFKGTVNTVAGLLDVSAQTIYRYLKEIEKQNQ